MKSETLTDIAFIALLCFCILESAVLIGMTLLLGGMA